MRSASSTALGAPEHSRTMSAPIPVGRLPHRRYGVLLPGVDDQVRAEGLAEGEPGFPRAGQGYGFGTEFTCDLYREQPYRSGTDHRDR
ncbi:hypothetical protein RKD38_000194 [Streptomyces ambofaciens]